VVVPLAKDRPWAESWDLSAAARATGYGLAGYVTTWKIGTTYSPITDIRIRATRSRDIRAPNLQEQMADPNTQNFSIFDPATGVTILTPATVIGNTALKPEKGDNTSV